MAKKGTREIEVSVLLEGEVKLFLSPTTQLGEEILKRLSSGECRITVVGGTAVGGVGKLPENTIVIEKVINTPSPNNSEDEDS